MKVDLNDIIKEIDTLRERYKIGSKEEKVLMLLRIRIKESYGKP